MAADMRACGRALVERAVVIAKCGDFAEPFANDGTLSRSQLVGGIDFARGDILGKTLDRRRILREVIADRACRLARRLVKFAPRAFSPQNQVGINRPATTPWVMPWPESPVATKTRWLPGLRPMNPA